ncbi:hypothetical protein C1H76_8609 [Elsinoe australis]|uniref:Uncharacterized protein n=1 Tax=Elsinoe australis TaxID=40998 RepID=A0A4U7ARY8_9PEZI|nr:hypothetical protein C1H76_8609 [Elsinoe australis]
MSCPAPGFPYDKAGFWLSLIIMSRPHVYLYNAWKSSTAIGRLEGHVEILDSAVAFLQHHPAAIGPAGGIGSDGSSSKADNEVKEIRGSLSRIKRLPHLVSMLIWPLYENVLQQKTRDVYRRVKMQVRTLPPNLADLDHHLRDTTNAIQAVEVRLTRDASELSFQLHDLQTMFLSLGRRNFFSPSVAAGTDTSASHTYVDPEEETAGKEPTVADNVQDLIEQEDDTIHDADANLDQGVAFVGSFTDEP